MSARRCSRYKVFGADPAAFASTERHHRLMGDATRTASASLSITVEGEPPSGDLVSSSGQRWAFRGWIELAAAIEQWRAAERRPPPATDTPTAPA